MLEKYKIINENNEEILYLYLNINFEFANDLTSSELIKKANSYLITHNIKFNGNKAIFIINGIKSKPITINKNITQYKNDYLITLKNKEKLSIKEILLGLLFTNINIDLKEETLKSITVLYRSEIINNILKNNYLNQEELTLSYHSYNYYKITYPKTYHAYIEKFNNVIDKTNGEYLIYNNTPINCYTHLVSNGYTEENKNIPYTTKKESLWDLTYKDYMQIKNYSIKEFKEKLNLTEDNFNIKIVSISNSNRIKELDLGTKRIDARSLAIYLDLPSTDITIIIKKDYLTFITRGIGSGLGLSIIGSDNLAELGYNYRQILNYYFKDVKLVTLN